jgi:hypothetical protein
LLAHRTDLGTDNEHVEANGNGGPQHADGQPAWPLGLFLSHITTENVLLMAPTQRIGAMNIFVTMPIRITTDLAARIDEFWHTRRLVSRASAIRELLEIGLSRPGHPQDGAQADEEHPDPDQAAE